MTRQTISETVCKYLARALDIEAVGIDTSQSMVDLGANSLDIVEVVSSTMRELRIKIPRENLQNIPNVDGLVDVLLEHAA